MSAPHPPAATTGVSVDPAALARVLDAETRAVAAGEPLPAPGTKLILLAALEAGRVGPANADALRALSLAAGRNRAALAARRNAARALLGDLNARLADAADDGTYTRAQALGLTRLPDPSTGAAR